MADDLTEEDYYQHLVADLEDSENPSFDHVGSYDEWQKYKAALRRWLDEKDAEWTEVHVFPDA